MKKTTIIKIIPLLALLVTGCDLKVNTHSNSIYSSPSNNSSEDVNSSEFHSSSDNNSSSHHSSGNHSSSGNNSSSGNVSSQTQSSEEGGSSTKTIEIYATNDIHGQIDPEKDGEDVTRMGVGVLMSYLKDKKSYDNTLLLDQGDTWQGQIYSNYNHGALITDVMNYVGYDARSVGNHDFDWGAECISINKNREYDGYSTPVLAGNVYDYNISSHTFGNTQQADLGDLSVTYTLENGLKVGILGGIGEDQVESICAEYTKTIGFKNHIDFIKAEAQRLRNVEKCDVVIASIHAPQDQIMGNGLDKDNDYVDLVLCGHSHKEESANEGTLYYSQNKAYTQSLGHITLTYDCDKKDVISTNIECLPADYITSLVGENIDPTIESIINNYKNECNSEASEVLARNVSGNWNTGNLADLMCKAIYDQCELEGYDDVLLAYCNYARQALDYKTQWTYADVFEAFPFDNVVYIADITGSEFLSEIKKYHYIYRSPTNFPSNDDNNKIDPNGTYKIAVIDYLYLHVDKYHYYNYFPISRGTSNVKLSKNYRLILRDWLIRNEYNLDKGENTKLLKAYDYYTSRDQHNRNVFVENTDL